MERRDVTKLDCDTVDALAGASALGALPADEERAVAQHLATCDRPHEELRGAAGTADLFALALPEEDPSPALRARIMRSIDAPAATDAPAPPIPLRRGSRSWLMPSLAGLAAAAVLALAVWNVQLRAEVGDQQASLARLADAVAAGSAAYRASGSVGSGYLIDAENPVLVASLPRAPAGRLYEMWLLDASGAPVAVGTFEADPHGGPTIVQLERPLSGFATFAITVEPRRVDAPSGKPVLAASLPG
jgi:anti-sigma-K factor RskA